MYHGPWGKSGKIKQLAHLRVNYSGKNMRGGRKCIFAQSSAYKNYTPTAIPWPRNESKLPRFIPPANPGVKIQ